MLEFPSTIPTIYALRYPLPPIYVGTAYASRATAAMKTVSNPADVKVIRLNAKTPAAAKRRPPSEPKTTCAKMV